MSFLSKLDKMVDRISMALIIASLVVGSALIIQSGRGIPSPEFGFSTIGYYHLLNSLNTGHNSNSCYCKKKLTINFLHQTFYRYIDLNKISLYISQFIGRKIL